MRGKPHAAFDVAGTGNVARSRWCDTRRRKGEATGNTNIDLTRRASPRPYQLSSQRGRICPARPADRTGVQLRPATYRLVVPRNAR